MYRKSAIRLLALLLALVTSLTACGEPNSKDPEPVEVEPSPLSLTVCVPEVQDTLDPARVTAQGGDMILHHLYENLMRWEDDGTGWAVLAPGQAERYDVDTDYAGNATYTFTLREDAVWSDGQAVTASDFVNAWRRLADPASGLPHRDLLEVVSGYSQVQETGDTSLLAVSAPDAHTFVVSLTGSCAWFLQELCAGIPTMPVRNDLPFDGTVTNGAYIASQFSSEQTVLVRSETYYDKSRQQPDKLCFIPSSGAEEDYQKFLNGERDLVTAPPDAVLQEQADSWTPEPVTGLTAVLLRTQQPPFDNPDVRLAFRLVIDTRAVADAAGIPTIRAASGVVPYGIADYGERPVVDVPVEEEPTLPDPNAVPVEEPEEPAPAFWDFRTHSLEKVTVPVEADYESDCQQARQLLAKAGYPNGTGFPSVEYIYEKSAVGDAVAKALQDMWWRQLGVTVTVQALSLEEYNARLTPKQAAEEEEDSGTAEEAVVSFAMAVQDITVPCSDAGVLLNRWHSTSLDDVSGYQSDAFDILLNAAQAAVSSEVRDAYLHDAEAILLTEAPVIPLYYQGGGYLLGQDLSGLYRAPDGVYFLYAMTKATAPT